MGFETTSIQYKHIHCFFNKKVCPQKVSAFYKEELPKIRLLISNLPIDTKMTFEVLTEEGIKQISLITKKQGKFSGNEFICDEWGLSVKELTPRIVIVQLPWI